MGKVRRAKPQTSILRPEKISYVPLRQRRLLEYRIDLARVDGSSDGVEYSATIEDAKDAVVKVIIRYRAEDEKRARSILEETMEQLKAVAHHVRQPKKIILREPVRRIEGVKYTSKPLDAAKIWLEKRRPKNYEVEDILKKLGAYLEAVADPDKQTQVRPTPMAIRSFLVDNFMPFKGLHVVKDIADGVYGIIGRYDEQEERSNRAGKSALLDSFLFSLFGEGRKLGEGKKAITATQNMYDGTDYFETGVGLEIDNSISISRKVQRKGMGQKPVVTLGDAVVSAAEVKEEITKLLGMNKTDFVKTSYVRQGDLLGMLEGASGQLKEDIIRWKGLGIWSDAEKVIEKEQSENEKKIRRVEASREVYLRSVESGKPDESEIFKIKVEIKEVESHNRKVDAAKERFETLKGKLRTAHVVEEALKDIEKALGKDKQLEEVRKELVDAEKWNNEVAAAKSKVSEIKSKLKIATQVSESISVVSGKTKLETGLEFALGIQEIVKKELAQAQEVFGQKNKVWVECKERADKGFDGKCPVDSKSCPRTEEINADAKAAKERKRKAKIELEETKRWVESNEEKRDENQSEIENLKNNLQKCKVAENFIEENRGLESVVVLEKQLEKAQEAADREPKSTNHIRGSFEDLIEITGRAKDAARLVKDHSDVESVRELTQALDKLREEAGEGKYSVGGLQDQLTSMLAKVKMYRQAEKALKESEQELKDLQKAASILSYLRHLTGKRGVPSMMIEDAMIEIVDGVNTILDDLGTDHRLEFEFERELQKLASHCDGCGAEFPETAKVKFCEHCGAERGRERADEMRPMVREGDRLQEFTQDSGAGRALIALAVRIVLSRFMGATVLFLDEVTSELDDYHLPTMIRLLTKLPEMGFRQVFVISHQKQIADAMPRNIVVTRIPSESRSTVGWEGEL